MIALAAGCAFLLGWGGCFCFCAYWYSKPDHARNLIRVLWLSTMGEHHDADTGALPARIPCPICGRWDEEDTDA